MKNVVLLQTAIADYRDQFIDECLRRADERSIDISIFVGYEYFESSTRTSSFVLSRPEVVVVKNIFLFGRRFLIQKIPYVKVFGADVVVCELNPRIINTWLVVGVRKMLGKPTVLWGHAWGRNGKVSKMESIRNFLRKCSSALLLYTETQRKEIATYAPISGALVVAPNSLYRCCEIRSVFVKNAGSILYVGRLVRSKKVDFLIRATTTFLKDNPECLLEIVGQGEEVASLQILAEQLGVADQVVFHGHIAARNSLEKIYARSFVSVSPGYVGLSITQSFSFGVPMLVSRDENHSPELEALRPGFNGDFYDTDDEADFLRVLNKYYRGREEVLSRSNAIVADCQQRYSVEKMAEGFYESISAAVAR